MLIGMPIMFGNGCGFLARRKACDFRLLGCDGWLFVMQWGGGGIKGARAGG